MQKYLGGENPDYIDGVFVNRLRVLVWSIAYLLAFSILLYFVIFNFSANMSHEKLYMKYFLVFVLGLFVSILIYNVYCVLKSKQNKYGVFYDGVGISFKGHGYQYLELEKIISINITERRIRLFSKITTITIKYYNYKKIETPKIITMMGSVTYCKPLVKFFEQMKIRIREKQKLDIPNQIDSGMNLKNIIEVKTLAPFISIVGILVFFYIVITATSNMPAPNFSDMGIQSR